MARNLNITLQGRTYSLAPSKLERKKLYGWTELRVTTPDGEECSQAGLNSDGMTVIPSGDTKNGILRQDGQWMDRSELVATLGGKRLEPLASSFDTDICLTDRASNEDLLDCQISSVYQLIGEEALLLASKLRDEIYRFPFSYRGGYELSDAFILAVGPSVYIISGNSSEFPYIGMDEQGELDAIEEDLNLEDDDLDFNMF